MLLVNNKWHKIFKFGIYHPTHPFCSNTIPIFMEKTWGKRCTDATRNWSRKRGTPQPAPPTVFELLQCCCPWSIHDKVEETFPWPKEQEAAILRNQSYSVLLIPRCACRKQPDSRWNKRIITFQGLEIKQEKRKGKQEEEAGPCTWPITGDTAMFYTTRGHLPHLSSVATHKRSACCRFLFILWFWTRSVEHLKEIRSLCPHPSVDVCFAAFDVVVQIVPEYVDQVNSIVPRSLACMPWKQNKGNISNIFPNSGICVL